MSSPLTSTSHDHFSSSGTRGIVKQYTKQRKVNLLFKHLLPLPIQRIVKSCRSSLGINNGMINKQYLYVLVKTFALIMISSILLLFLPLPAFAKGGGGSGGGGDSGSYHVSSSRESSDFWSDVIGFSFGMMILIIREQYIIRKEREINAAYRKEQQQRILNSGKKDDGVTFPPIKLGTFRGESVEIGFKGKSITQSVKTKFYFDENGLLSGSGHDSDDGSYNVDGSWKKVKTKEEGVEKYYYDLNWIEKYDKFTVTVKGKMTRIEDKSNSSYEKWMITGSYESSLGISGTLEIKYD